MSSKVVVIGNGVAGVAAAFGARQAGADVTVVSTGVGASMMMSGALDDGPWDLQHAEQPVTPSLQALCEALGLWVCEDAPALVASPLGLVRPARARDRQVLDLSTLRPEARIAVPAIDRPDWRSQLLVKAWNADARAVARKLQFQVVEVPVLESDLERLARDAAVARRFDNPERLSRLTEVLRPLAASFDAVLVGPWLGLGPDVAARVSSGVGKPVGETLTYMGGTAGERFERAAEVLLERTEVKLVRATVAAVSRQDGKLVINLAEGEPLQAEAVVVACGGVVSGGLEIRSSEWQPAAEIPAAASRGLHLSFEAPLALRVDGALAERTSSLHGIDVEAFRWPAAQQLSRFENASVLHRDLKACGEDLAVIDRVFVAGAVAGAGCAALACVRHGLSAGAMAAQA